MARQKVSASGLAPPKRISHVPNPNAVVNRTRSRVIWTRLRLDPVTHDPPAVDPVSCSRVHPQYGQGSTYWRESPAGVLVNCQLDEVPHV